MPPNAAYSQAPPTQRITAQPQPNIAQSMVARTVQPVPAQKPPEQAPSTQPQPAAAQAVRRALVQPSPIPQKAPPQLPLAQAQPYVAPHCMARSAVQSSLSQRPSMQFAQGAPTATH